MRRYKNYLDDVTQTIAKSTSYDRRIARMQHDEPGINENMRVSDLM